MKKLLLATLLLFAACAPAIAEQGADLSPAEHAISDAKEEIAADPAKPGGYAALAFAYARRARETGGADYYAWADEAAQKSLDLAPDNFEALKARTWALLGRHEFAAARDLAERLNKMRPDDLQTYGFLADANAELGDYGAAETATNWMLKLRPGNTPALTRAAYLRELFGDLDGARDLMVQAMHSTSLAEVEDRAWILVQLAHLALLEGKADEAEKLSAEALLVFPGYHYALANLARAKLAQGRDAEAADLLRARYEAAPHPENLHELGEALIRAGRGEEAAKAFAVFEKAARKEADTWDNANRELVFYYADRANNPKEALRIATLDYSRRKDVYTRDAYAWALHRSGRAREAIEQLDAIKAVGLRDPAVQARAAAIIAAAGA